ncbi:MAG: MBOAT family O-acyltransferase, partial [Cellulosilyticaceae bacterium]
MWLLGASYYFYMCWNPQYALLIATSTIITYLSGILIHKSNRLKDERKKVKQKKLWVTLSFTSNLLILFFFKYFDFTVDSLNVLLQQFHIQFAKPNFDVMLPVGISFYTFQALSYTMDVYRGDIDAERNIGKYALFVSFFPQLVAGPIERSKNLLLQINDVHTFNYERMKSGLCMMLWGFFQKIVIADRIAILVNEVFNNYTKYRGFEVVVAVVLFAVQIYCDFSGYS